MDFNNWMLEVDGLLANTTGLTTSDLADQDYWNAYKDGTSINEMVEVILEDEGYADPIDSLDRGYAYQGE